MTTNSAVFCTRENSEFFPRIFKTHQPRVFVQNANSTYSLPGRSVEKLPAGWRASPPSFLPSLLLSLYTADPAFELNRDCVRTNDERASERSVGLWRGRKKTTASPPPPPRKRRASSRSCSARARVKVPIRPSVRPSPLLFYCIIHRHRQRCLHPGMGRRDLSSQVGQTKLV